MTLFRDLKGFDIPEIITKDNINIPLKEGTTLINRAFEFGNLSIILYFKSLGAKLNAFSAYNICNIEGATAFFEMGGEKYGEFPFAFMVMRDKKELVYYLIDYGINTSNRFVNSVGHFEFNNYISTQIVPRVSNSRKALVALIICCKQRTHQGTLVFGAVRDVLFALAREMWAQKGPADKCCGPRSTRWAKKNLYKE